MEKQNCPYVHVYPQDYWHTPAFIVLNKESITEIKKAIKELEEGKTISTIDCSAQDGEWYNLVFVVDDFSKPLFCQYEDEICGKEHCKGKHPETMEDYQKFIRKRNEKRN